VNHLHLLESTLVVVAPRKALGRVLLLQRILHLTRC